MLKAVYRRGAGAFSSTHRPGMSRSGWGVARVNAFLKLVRSGKPSNPKYVQDNDLLPVGIPEKHLINLNKEILLWNKDNIDKAEVVEEITEAEESVAELDDSSEEVAVDEAETEEDADLMVEAVEPTEEEQAAHDKSFDCSEECADDCAGDCSEECTEKSVSKDQSEQLTN